MTNTQLTFLCTVPASYIMVPRIYIRSENSIYELQSISYHAVSIQILLHRDDEFDWKQSDKIMFNSFISTFYLLNRQSDDKLLPLSI